MPSLRGGMEFPHMVTNGFVALAIATGLAIVAQANPAPSEAAGPLANDADNLHAWPGVSVESAAQQGHTHSHLDPIDLTILSVSEPDSQGWMHVDASYTPAWADVAATTLRVSTRGALLARVESPPAPEASAGETEFFSVQANPATVGESLLMLKIDALGGNNTLGAYRQVYFLKDAEGDVAWHVDHLPPTEGPLQAEQFGTTQFILGPPDPTEPSSSGACLASLEALGFPAIPLCRPKVTECQVQGASVECQAAAGDTFVVKGCWKYYDENDVLQPQPRIRVEVWDHDTWSPDDQLWWGNAGPDGCFTSGSINLKDQNGGTKNQDIYLMFITLDSPVRVEKPKPWYDLGDPDVTEAYAWRFPFSGDTEVADGVQTVEFLNIAPYDDAGRAAARLFQYVQKAHQYATQTMGFPTSQSSGEAAMGHVHVRYPDEGCPEGTSARYRRAGDRIYVCGDAVADRSPDIIMHEYGHHVMDQAYGSFTPQLVPGAHAPCMDNVARPLSWMEGFADWFGAQAHQATMPPYDRLYAKKGIFSIDMELGNYCGSLAQGDDEEMRIAWSLWDLVDAESDGLDVGFQEDPARIAIVLKACDDANYEDFYNQGCSWISHGYPAASFLRTAFWNTIDYNQFTATQVTSQSAFGWHRRSLLLEATASDPDGMVEQVEFRLSPDSTCADDDTFVGLDLATPWSASFDPALFGDDDAAWSCARAYDGMEWGPFDASDAALGIDNTRPTVVLSVTYDDPEANLEASATEPMSPGSGLVPPFSIFEYKGGTETEICSSTASGPFAGLSCIDPTPSPDECYIAVAWDNAGNRRSSWVPGLDDPVPDCFIKTSFPE